MYHKARPSQSLKQDSTPDERVGTRRKSSLCRLKRRQQEHFSFQLALLQAQIVHERRPNQRSVTHKDVVDLHSLDCAVVYVK